MRPSQRNRGGNQFPPGGNRYSGAYPPGGPPPPGSYGSYHHSQNTHWLIQLAHDLSGPLQRMAQGSAFVKLVLCIIIDLIGMCTYLVPMLGEMADAVWAPLQAWLVYYLFGHNLLFSSLAFFEEALPYTDIIPTACVGWVLENVSMESLDPWRRMTGIALRQPRQRERSAGECIVM